MLAVRNHWYWTRAEMRPYTVVVADLVGEKEFNYASTQSIFIAKDGKTITDNRDKLQVYRSNTLIQEEFGKPVSLSLVQIKMRDNIFLHSKRIIISLL
mmetsp:Transcript_12831/g.19667  ORF Transcript_12831/g.19667 Transcript_12831/m.19667 type:complete len:98 (-) Transcript_12831:237-530(-)